MGVYVFNMVSTFACEYVCVCAFVCRVCHSDCVRAYDIVCVCVRVCVSVCPCVDQVARMVVCDKLCATCVCDTVTLSV